MIPVATQRDEEFNHASAAGATAEHFTNILPVNINN
jgi:hypothetical protein